MAQMQSGAAAELLENLDKLARTRPERCIVLCRLIALTARVPRFAAAFDADPPKTWDDVERLMEEWT